MANGKISPVRGSNFPNSAGIKHRNTRFRAQAAFGLCPMYGEDNL
jgi:hypothetical protein